MPTLDWIGKQAVVNHHQQVPYRLLHCDPARSAGDPESPNLLVQGDNLLALKALLPYYAGKVKCIYIDPPYNTGNEGWIYNDNVNAPEIKQWLGKTVGKEAEDLSRHDKWLCMMYPRLQLLREFLSEDGVIFVSIDENECHHLHSTMTEIFGARCYLETLVWKARQYPDSRALTGISHDHEYIMVFSRSPGAVRLLGRSRDESKYKNPDGDARGPWMSRSILGLADKSARPNLHYDLIDPKTGFRYPCPANTGWRYSRDTMAAKIAEGRIIFPKKVTGRPREKVFSAELQSARTGFPSIVDGIFTADGSTAIRTIFGDQVFAFPKPPALIESIVGQGAGIDSLILDSFGGSGTTGHAVLEMNKRDAGNRRFILIEMEEKIATDVTAQRLRRVIEGYKNSKGEQVEGLGGGFRYCTLSDPLFNADGSIREQVKYKDLAHHVFFTETGRPLPKNTRGPLLGTHEGKSIYLLFNGILHDKSIAGGNVLTRQTLESCGGTSHDGERIIYGEGSRLSAATLKRLRVTFKQLPYDVKVS